MSMTSAAAASIHAVSPLFIVAGSNVPAEAPAKKVAAYPIATPMTDKIIVYLRSCPLPFEPKICSIDIDSLLRGDKRPPSA